MSTNISELIKKAAREIAEAEGPGLSGMGTDRLAELIEIRITAVIKQKRAADEKVKG